MATFLIVQRGPEIGGRYELQSAVTTIGRSEDNDITFDDPYISRYHAVIKQLGSDLIIIDLGSENPVQIRDTPLEPGEPYTLQNRDIIRIGQNVLSYIDTSKIPARPVAPVSATPSVNTGGVPTPNSYSSPLPAKEEYNSEATVINLGYSPKSAQLDDDAKPTGRPSIYSSPISSTGSQSANPVYGYGSLSPKDPEEDELTLMNSTPGQPPIPSQPPYISQNQQYGNYAQPSYGGGQPQNTDAEATQIAGYGNQGLGWNKPLQQQTVSGTDKGKEPVKPPTKQVEPEIDPEDAPTTIIRIEKIKQ
jgi:hypothetical protein